MLSGASNFAQAKLPSVYRTASKPPFTRSVCPHDECVEWIAAIFASLHCGRLKMYILKPAVDGLLKQGRDSIAMQRLWDVCLHSNSKDSLQANFAASPGGMYLEAK
eukprot:6077441-Amphidinium_carterae.3